MPNWLTSTSTILSFSMSSGWIGPQAPKDPRLDLDLVVRPLPFLITKKIHLHFWKIYLKLEPPNFENFLWSTNRQLNTTPVRLLKCYFLWTTSVFGWTITCHASSLSIIRFLPFHVGLWGSIVGRSERRFIKRKDELLPFAGTMMKTLRNLRAERSLNNWWTGTDRKCIVH